MSMYEINQLVEIVNHSEPSCNGQLGTITDIQLAYDGYTQYYTVLLEESDTVCSCTVDELMEA
jgi:hypothetical protein